MEKNKILLTIISFLYLSGCGYTIVKHSGNNNFNLVDISTSGVQKINHKINNRLTFNSSQDSKNQIQINLNTIKSKTIKEKNIKNEITKYEITITTKVIYTVIHNKRKKGFSISKSGDLNVASNTLQTLNNEKRLTEILGNKIVESILERLNIELNDS
jgi:hypothetical protein